ncbi:MAG: TIGR03621 family F420-dependent LLM class oxidoreductase [Acidimicrobiia bacterium]|nr:TIGR03621 family F420-dependent LLM class oxidoreductase [Acidimicrobiia bacterium]MDH5237611.1 TIGR03621 family F420-dependent LLM class oxidoreductase [Acidimicrobiia bacterium]
MAKPFRFGIQLANPAPGLTWADTARRAEDAGIDTLFMPDHFEDQLAPIPALATAAAATTDLKVGALVLGNDYRHPVVLAKELATIDVLSGGRMEIGIGAGWMRTDYEQAGIDYDRPGERIERLTEAVEVIRGCMGPEPFSFEGVHYQVTSYDGRPKPIQDRPDLLIGGGGRRMLGVAARLADIVGVTANLRAGEIGPDAVANSVAASFDEKLGWVREAAGDRFDQLELSSLTLDLQVTNDRDAVLAGMAELFGIDVDAAAEVPMLLVGTIEQICETLEARRERWGFSYPVLQGTDFEVLGQIVSRLGGR